MTYQTFNISLPKDLVSAMDDVARLEYRNRSDLIREAVRMYLVDTKAWNALFAYGEKQAKRLKISSEDAVLARVAAYRKGK
jgi:Arc/MetJ-type ribon-helix-helix transcriptional regulator